METNNKNRKKNHQNTVCSIIFKYTYIKYTYLSFEIIKLFRLLNTSYYSLLVIAFTAAPFNIYFIMQNHTQKS
jgi:hypothetical protein